jgi:hypothetical protein
MTHGHPSADMEAVVPPAVPGLGRERVTVRHRRARQGRSPSRGQWVTPSRSRRRAVRTFALCTGVLLLMAIGLYFGLARQENAAPPAHEAIRVGAVGGVGVV